MKDTLLVAAIAALTLPALDAVEVAQTGDQVSIANAAFSLSYNLKSGAWSATDLAAQTTVFANARFTVDETGWKKPAGATREWKQSEVSDDFGTGRTLTITETPGGGYAPVKSLHLTVYDKQPFAALGFSVTNQRAFPMRVARIGVIDKAAFLPGKKLTQPQVLRGGAGAQKNQVENLAAIDTQFEKTFTPEEISIVATQFDSVTPENCMKWQVMCPEEGTYRFEDIDLLMNFATKNQQSFVGHTLLFNRDGDYPKWLFRDGSKEADAKLVWKRIEDHATKVMTRYAGKIDSWDVLNEFIEVPAPGYRITDLTRVLGADFPERLFKLAAELDPKAKMTYNDFSVENPARLKAILAFVRKLRDNGCKIDVIGSQSHLEIGERTGANLDNMIKQFAAEGFRCALTELDVDVIPRHLYWNPKTRDDASKINPYVNGCPPEILEKQANTYREAMGAVMANIKHVDRVAFWGFTDARSWLNHWPWKRVNHGLLFDRESKPKPAFHAIADMIKKGELPVK